MHFHKYEIFEIDFQKYICTSITMKSSKYISKNINKEICLEFVLFWDLYSLSFVFLYTYEFLCITSE